MKLCMFRTFFCPPSGVYSLYTQQWHMSYRFVDSFRAGPGWNSGRTTDSRTPLDEWSARRTYLSTWQHIQHSW